MAEIFLRQQLYEKKGKRCQNKKTNIYFFE